MIKSFYSNYNLDTLEEETKEYQTIQYKNRKYIKRMSQGIANERLKFMDDIPLGDVSIRIEDGKTVRKVRRIIEKRVCQNWYKQKSNKHVSNLDRSGTKRWVTNQFKNIYNFVPEGFHYCA